MKIEKIKPIPQKMVAEIKRTDKRINRKTSGTVRYYAYLANNDGELVKITVAVKEHKGKWYCKQVAVHGLHSEKCFCRDIEYSYMGGYKVGWHAEGLYSSPRWWEDGKWYDTVDDKYFNPYAHLINPEYAYRFPEFKYSASELYKGDDIIAYLRTYEKYPQAEMLVKLGLSRYTESKQILEKVGKDKKFRKYIATNREELARPCYYISTIFTAYKTNTPLKEAQIFEAKKKYLQKKEFAPIRTMLQGDYKPFFEYLEKQRITDYLYLDYLKACNFLGLDMTEAKNRYPHDFKRWHDIRIDEYHTAKALKDEQERKDLYAKFTAIAEKYLPMTNVKKGGYIVVIATSPADLMKEGEALHHCVGRMGYDQKMVREESLIFFIRSADDITKPLATVEYSIKSKKVLQCYADHNSRPDEQIMNFVNNIWLPYANRSLKKIAA